MFESHQAFSHIQILLPRVSLVTSLAIAKAYLKSFRSVFKASNLCNLTVSQTWHPYSIICESQLTFILLLLPDQQSPVEQVVTPSLLILEKTPFPPPPLSLFSSISYLPPLSPSSLRLYSTVYLRCLFDCHLLCFCSSLDLSELAKAAKKKLQAVSWIYIAYGYNVKSNRLLCFGGIWVFFLTGSWK